MNYNLACDWNLRSLCHAGLAGRAVDGKGQNVPLTHMSAERGRRLEIADRGGVGFIPY